MLTIKGIILDTRMNHSIADIDFLSRCIKCRAENKGYFCQMEFQPKPQFQILF